MHIGIAKIPAILIFIRLLTYFWFYVMLILSFKIKTKLYFMLITILIWIISINYMILINSTKIYKMQKQLLISLD